jgi:hypothetical protein
MWPIEKTIEWTDLEKVIELQTPTYVFAGDHPKNPGDCFRHYQLVVGTSVTALSRDRHRKSTLRFHRNRSIPLEQKRNRKLNLMSKYVDILNFSPENAKPGTPRWLPTRAVEEPLVMLKMLIANYLERNVHQSAAPSRNTSSSHPKVHPLRMISIFKDCLKSEEMVFRFDILALDERCVRLLRKVQAVCLEQSPVDYPSDEYAAIRR